MSCKAKSPSFNTLPMKINLNIRVDKNRLICNVIQAYNLMLLGDNGISDPCLKIQIIKISQQNAKYNLASNLAPRTRVVKRTLDPVWNETLKLVFRRKNQNRLALLVQCWNSDKFESGDLIGYHIIDISSIINSQQNDWLELYPNNKLPVQVGVDGQTVNSGVEDLERTKEKSVPSLDHLHNNPKTNIPPEESVFGGNKACDGCAGGCLCVIGQSCSKDKVEYTCETNAASLKSSDKLPHSKVENTSHQDKTNSLDVHKTVPGGLLKQLAVVLPPLGFENVPQILHKQSTELVHEHQ